MSSTKQRFKPPPNLWFIAYTTEHARALGFEPGLRVAVRQSRSGGWRICGLNRMQVVGDRHAKLYVNTGDVTEVCDQAKAEAHFQALLKASDAERAAS